jgi:putative component of toxin-antitoxin plasmid stabilization module
MQYRVTFYFTEDGARPVAGFLRDLEKSSPEVHDLVVAGLLKLRDRGYHRKPLTDVVDGTDGILELRVGRDTIARVFFFFQPGQVIVCTNGYLKKSMKLDPREIERARRSKQDWERRFPKGAPA